MHDQKGWREKHLNKGKMETEMEKVTDLAQKEKKLNKTKFFPLYFLHNMRMKDSLR